MVTRQKRPREKNLERYVYFRVTHLLRDVDRQKAVRGSAQAVRRARLFSSFVRSSLAHAFVSEKGRRVPQHHASVRTPHHTASDCDDADEAPPHALDAIIPIEEASERGERAIMALAAVEDSRTRIPHFSQLHQQQKSAQRTLEFFFLALARARVSAIEKRVSLSLSLLETARVCATGWRC